MESWVRLALVVLVAACLVACESATQIPAGGQVVHVSSTPSGLQVEPSIVPPGNVYLVLEEPLRGVEFVHRTADMNDPHSPPLPVTDDDLDALRRQGSFEGAAHDGLSVHVGSVIRIGPLIEGRYALLDGSVAVLEVRP